MDIKNWTGIVRIQKTTFKDKDYFEIRKYYLDETTQEYKPTRKGITLSIELLDDIRKAINSI